MDSTVKEQIENAIVAVKHPAINLGSADFVNKRF